MGLVLADGLAKGLSLLSICHCGLECRPCHADSPRCRVDTTNLDAAEYLEEPLTLLAAEQIGRRHAEIIHR